ncbi:5214_t:CDS:2 [Scutellospora calospora]|uniref:5214_t:CDS:1 n=1 Tax=Scutellospora calospora TaxID=85575 RepID=A0ACA9JTY4_9GLOM|nr:5214_t:CDS:2 [Scutellospora calospora]
MKQLDVFFKEQKLRKIYKTYFSCCSCKKNYSYKSKYLYIPGVPLKLSSTYPKIMLWQSHVSSRSGLTW